ncbi:hypothetical protein PR048_001801 [Dryococelus australis]|uniref:Uncharacterized protein n=1 Tax=Dryococelus australis TaxID=614101 RepID=A0ABQ9IIH3_9NEOP|nr:hypothetical protein PR048_001801 [Dryococelus australis]
MPEGVGAADVAPLEREMDHHSATGVGKFEEPRPQETPSAEPFHAEGIGSDTHEIRWGVGQVLRLRGSSSRSACRPGDDHGFPSHQREELVQQLETANLRYGSVNDRLQITMFNYVMDKVTEVKRLLDEAVSDPEKLEEFAIAFEEVLEKRDEFLANFWRVRSHQRLRKELLET